MDGIIFNSRHVIWSDINLNIDDWIDAYKEYLDANQMKFDPNDENEIYKWVSEKNDELLNDERKNLNIQLPQKILVIAYLDLWNGRAMGYKEISSCNIKDCLYSDTDYTEWYVDRYGDLRANAVHHDGTNHYLYRVYKNSSTDREQENLKEKIITGMVENKDINRITRKIGDEIGKVYGWNFHKNFKDLEMEER